MPQEALDGRPLHDPCVAARIESGTILTTNERNTRLLEARALKVGDPLVGKIGMKQDGQWYLIDTGLE